MCNLGWRRAYGRDALVAGPVHEYEVDSDYSPSPEQEGALPFYENEEREYFFVCILYGYYIARKHRIVFILIILILLTLGKASLFI